MNKKEWLDILARLELTKDDVADLADCSPESVRKWISGNRETPRLVAAILQAADRGAIDLGDLR